MGVLHQINPNVNQNVVEANMKDSLLKIDKSNNKPFSYDSISKILNGKNYFPLLNLGSVLYAY